MRVERARAAQRIYERSTQAGVDIVVTAADWAIVQPARNRALAELAVEATGIGNVEDKIRKNYRKTFGLLHDLKGARSVGVIAVDEARGIVEIARPVGVVCAVTPSTNPGATPANKIINALKGRNAASDEVLDDRADAPQRPRRRNRVAGQRPCCVCERYAGIARRRWQRCQHRRRKHLTSRPRPTASSARKPSTTRPVARPRTAWSSSRRCAHSS